VLSMHTLKPLDVRAVLAATRETGGIFTLEEHSLIGGLGSAVAEILAESGESVVPFQRFALPPIFSCKVGTQEYLRAQNGLSAESLAEAVFSRLAEVRVLAARGVGS